MTKRSSVLVVRSSLALVALVALLPLLACGSDPAPPDASATPSASAPASSPAPSTQASAEPSPVVTGLATSMPLPRRTRGVPVRLTGDGIELPTRVVVFGDTLAAVQPDLLRFLGTPTTDTGPIDPFSTYGTCPGKDLRVLEFDGGALQVLFATMEGDREMTVFSWALTAASDTTPKASALIGDAATFEFGVGTTKAELEAGAGEALELVQDELTGPAFTVKDQSRGFFGTLEADRVLFVQAGTGCGE